VISLDTEWDGLLRMSRALLWCMTDWAYNFTFLKNATVVQLSACAPSVDLCTKNSAIQYSFINAWQNIFVCRIKALIRHCLTPNSSYYRCIFHLLLLYNPILFLPRHYHMTQVSLLPSITTVSTPVVLAIINTTLYIGHVKMFMI